MEDRDLILINLVKQYPHLYDRNNSGFKDKILVENSWKGIGFALKTSADDCQRRWYVLRNRYAKEKRDLESNIDPTRKAWPLMTSLTFLESHVKRRRKWVSRSFRAVNTYNLMNNVRDPFADESPQKLERWDHLDIEENKLEEPETEDLDQKLLNSDHSTQSSYFDDDDCKIISPEELNIKNSHSSVSDSGFTEPAESLTSPKSSTTDLGISSEGTNDSNMHFCLSLQAPLQKIPKHLLTRAKIEILQVLDKYEYKEYNNYKT